MKTLNALKLVQTECSCKDCREMCHWRPCWGTPAEIVKIMEAGHADKLMIDWWVGSRYDGNDDDILLVCPAGRGSEKGNALDGYFFSMPAQPCVMQVNGLCQLHEPGLKPIEGRMTHHEGGNPDLHEATAESWNSPEGQAVVLRWMRKVGYTGWRRSDLEELLKERTDA